MNDAPRISVCIPAFNAGRHISATIQSVLAQTFTDFELLIIDDGSTDDTLDVVSGFISDHRVRLIRSYANLGCPETRNRALDEARGEYLAWLDADDLCMPERLSKQAAFLDAYPGIAVVGSCYTLIDESGRPIEQNRRRRQSFTPDEIGAQLLFTCALHQPTMTGRRAIMQGYRYDPTFEVAEDHDVWARMARDHRFAVLPEPLLAYRQHTGQLTQTQLARITNARRIIQARELSLLGIGASSADIRNHDALFHLKGRRLFKQQTGFTLDSAFVSWAAEWLATLTAANQRLRRYPEPAFSRLLRARWHLVIRKAFCKGQRAAVAREWIRAPLGWRSPHSLGQWTWRLENASKMETNISNSAPAITVFIPAFNAEAYIASAIESVLKQADADFELLLIDDASTDGTLAVMQAYAHDSRVRIIAQANNQQRAKTRAHGVAEARGRYLAMLDADDLCLPGRLARQAGYLDANSDIDVVGSWWQRIDGDGNALPAKASRQALSTREVSAWMLFRCIIHNPTVMVRCDVLRQYRYEPDFPIAEDYAVWAAMVSRQGLAVLPEELTVYREHPGQVSTARAGDSLFYRQRVQARLLTRVGLTFSEQDLVRHSLLYTGRRLYQLRTGEPLDVDFIRWASQWLQRILVANEKSCVFDHAALERLVGQLWFSVCKKAAPSSRIGALSCFLQSRLTYRRFLARALRGPCG